MGKNQRFLSIHKILQSQLNLAHDTSIIVGVSGGADSTALLHLLSQSPLQFKLTAVYIDHGLRPTETPTEIAQVQSQAIAMGAEFICLAVDVEGLAHKEKRSTEDAARILRYNAFEKIRKQQGASYIAVAHNADDQVEEFFLRVLRGSGRKGLTGMPQKHKYLIRPLLDFTKQEILGYLKDHGIPHCEDSSNQERVYLRNKVRLDVLPYLEQYNPSLRKTVRKISHILAEEEDYLKQAAKEVFQSCVTQTVHDRAHLHCQLFLRQHRALQKRVVETLFWKIGSEPNVEYIEAVLDLAKGKNGRGIQCAENLKISKRAGQLVFFHDETPEINTEKALATITTPGTYTIDSLAKRLTLGSTVMEQVTSTVSKHLQIDATTLYFPLTIRYHLNGEKFLPLGAPGRKKVSRFLTDRKIHREAKKRHPVLTHKVDGMEKIIAVLGLEISDEYKTTESTQETMFICWQDM